MGTIQKLKKINSWVILVFCFASLTFVQTHAANKIQQNKNKSSKLGAISQKMYEQRIQHASELLGSAYRKSGAKKTEEIKKIHGSIYRWTKASLPKKHSHKHQILAQTVIDEAHRHGFDPVLLMAMIQTESSFNPEARGGVGEIGLMQILPDTGEWMAEKLGISWKGEKTLLDPVLNVKIGAAFVAYLRDYFDKHARLYLAAYNMGQKNVKRALKKNRWPKEYPARVMQNYVDFYASLNINNQNDKLDHLSETKLASRL